MAKSEQQFEMVHHEHCSGCDGPCTLRLASCKATRVLACGRVHVHDSLRFMAGDIIERESVVAGWSISWTGATVGSCQ